MADDVLDPALAEQLLARQALLQAQAADVLADLELIALLSSAGEAALVGSAAMGLMTQPDIDVSVVCDVWHADMAFQAVRRLASHPRVFQLSFLNQTGHFNPGFPTDGLYWGVGYRSEHGQEWKLDLWFWQHGATAGNQEYVEAVQRRLAPESRLAILWLKHTYQQLKRYGLHDVRSVDVYDAVLQHGVRSPAEFAAYLEAGQRPS